MNQHIEFKGKDIDEAINLACAKLRVSREELDIEVVSTGTAGIFGLCRKQAVIRATRKPRESEQAKTRPALTASPEPQPGFTPLEEPATEPAEVGLSRRDEFMVEEVADAPGAGSEAEPPGGQAAPLTPEILGQIKEDLFRLLTLMGFASEISVEERNQKALVKITGEHLAELTGKDGQALDSIQYLMRKIIGKKFPQKIMFAIDAGEFRETRRAELQALALKLAAEVKETEKTRMIPPLNPAERRIVHLVLQEDKAIRSRSVGDGLFKKILIYLPGKGRIRSKKTPRRKGRKDNLTSE